MKRLVFILASVLIAQGFDLHSAFAQQKLAQNGFNFLSVGTDARATGMGEAFTTIEGSSAAMFYNPAGLAGITSMIDISASQMTWIADIKYISGAAAYAPADGKYGVIGVSALTVDYGTFNFTQVANNDQGYVDIVGAPNPSAYVVGLGYGKALSDKFSVGGTVKYAYQNLGEALVPVYKQHVDTAGHVVTDTMSTTRKYAIGVLAFDFGTTYKTGLKSLAFGMSISNFSREVQYEREGFELPLTFKIGISMNIMDLVPDIGGDHSLFVSIDAIHPRSYVEYLNIGGEYMFMNTIALRVGYITHHSTDYGLTAGVGFRKFGIAVDYSYAPMKIFNDIQRLSVRFYL